MTQTARQTSANTADLSFRHPHAELAERLADHNLHVLDVRQPIEWRHGHIRGSQNTPLMHLKRHLSTLPRDRTIVTVCASGHPSAAAARMLQRAGYPVENLKGGMHAWTKAGLPVEKSTHSS